MLKSDKKYQNARNRTNKTDKKTQQLPYFKKNTIFSQLLSGRSAVRIRSGTLGGGNHFIEVDKDKNGCLYLVIHFGSRHLVSEIAQWYQKETYRRLCGNSQKDIDALIIKLKQEDRNKEIQKQINHLKTIKSAPVSEDFAYCEGELFDQYIVDDASYATICNAKPTGNGR